MRRSFGFSSLRRCAYTAQAAINYTCSSNTAPAFNYTLITKSSLSIKFLIKSPAFSLTPQGFGAHPAECFSLKPAWPVAFSIWLIMGLRPVFVALCNATLYHWLSFSPVCWFLYPTRRHRPVFCQTLNNIRGFRWTPVGSGAPARISV